MNTGYIRYKTFDVDPTLRGQFIKCLWSCEAIPNDGNHFIFRTYGSPYPTLIICKHGYITAAKGETTEKFLLLGQSNKWHRFRISNDFKIFGLTLYPFTLPLFFKIPAHRLTNRIHDGHQIFAHNELAQFCKQVNELLPQPAGISDLLLERLKDLKIDDGLIMSLIISASQSNSISMVTELPKMAFMSQRNFERKFKYYSGFPPKTFANLSRLIGAIRCVVALQNCLTQHLNTTTLINHIFQMTLKNTLAFHPVLL
jgi:hypothetical protein